MISKKNVVGLVSMMSCMNNTIFIDKPRSCAAPLFNGYIKWKVPVHQVQEVDVLMEMLGVEFRYKDYLEFLKLGMPS